MLSFYQGKRIVGNFLPFPPKGESDMIEEQPSFAISLPSLDSEEIESDSAIIPFVEEGLLK